MRKPLKFSSHKGLDMKIPISPVDYDRAEEILHWLPTNEALSIPDIVSYCIMRVYVEEKARNKEVAETLNEVAQKEY